MKMDVHLGLFLPQNNFGKTLKEGSAAFLMPDMKLRSFSEERLKGEEKFTPGFARSKQKLLALLDAENLNIQEAVSSYGSIVDLNSEILHAPHHVSHAFSAFALSGFDRAIVAVWDAGGDIYPTKGADPQKWCLNKREQHSYYLFEGNHFKLIDRDFFEPNEMGFGEVYRALTHLSGFNSYTDSSKAMALSAYGDANEIWIDEPHSTRNVFLSKRYYPHKEKFKKADIKTKSMLSYNEKSDS